MINHEDIDDHSDPLAARHPVLTLLSGPQCILSHCCRLVIMEKGIDTNIEHISAKDDPAKIGEANPYGETPTLVDRDLVLYDPSVIIEYLDERYPHPPLMPTDPVVRAKIRLTISRLLRDWLTPLSHLEDSGKAPSKELRDSIRDGLLAFSPLVRRMPFFVGQEYSMVDSYLAPLLWRLPVLGIEMPKQAEMVMRYARRMFRRPAFANSLSREESEMGALP